MSVSNTESHLEVVSVVSECSSLVLVSVSSTESTSVTSASVANVSITLVIPVVDVITVSVCVGEAIWSPSEVISSVDLSVMSVESLNVSWFVVTVTPDSIVLVVTKVFGWSEEATLGSSASKAESSREGFHLKVCNLKFVSEASKIKQRGLKSNSHILYTKLD